VNRLMLPPSRVCSEPPIVPKMERDRTVIPRTTPRFWATLYPSTVNVVVVIE
jgi:hypothetical protein